MKKTLILLTGLIASSCLFAGQQVYMGLGIASANISLPSLSDFTKYIAYSSIQTITSGYDTDARVFAGYNFAINKKYKTGIQFGYNSYNEQYYNSKNPVDTAILEFKNLQQLDFIWTNTYNPIAGLNIYAAVGPTLESISAKPSGTMTYYIKSGKTSTKILPKIGLGIGYDFNKKWEVAVNYYHAFGKAIDFKNFVNPDGTIADFNAPSTNQFVFSIRYNLNFGNHKSQKQVTS